MLETVGRMNAVDALLVENGCDMYHTFSYIVHMDWDTMMMNFVYWIGPSIWMA
jgi:hypothetical protein